MGKFTSRAMLNNSSVLKMWYTFIVDYGQNKYLSINPFFLSSFLQHALLSLALMNVAKLSEVQQAGRECNLVLQNLGTRRLFLMKLLGFRTKEVGSG